MGWLVWLARSYVLGCEGGSNLVFDSRLGGALVSICYANCFHCITVS